MAKGLQQQGVNRPDNFQTPDCALDYITPYLNKNWVIWECAEGKGNLVKGFEKRGFNVIGSDKEFNFLENIKDCDCIVTNPPYSLKENFIQRCYELKKPFALLMPLTALEGQKRQKMYKEFGIQLVIPNKRINFETPSGKQGGAWFLTAWFTNGLNLPNSLIFTVKTMNDTITLGI